MALKSKMAILSASGIVPPGRGGGGGSHEPERTEWLAANNLITTGMLCWPIYWRQNTYRQRIGMPATPHCHDLVFSIILRHFCVSHRNPSSNLSRLLYAWRPFFFFFLKNDQYQQFSKIQIIRSVNSTKYPAEWFKNIVTAAHLGYRSNTVSDVTRLSSLPYNEIICGAYRLLAYDRIGCTFVQSTNTHSVRPTLTWLPSSAEKQWLLLLSYRPTVLSSYSYIRVGLVLGKCISISFIALVRSVLLRKNEPHGPLRSTVEERKTDGWRMRFESFLLFSSTAASLQDVNTVVSS